MENCRERAIQALTEWLIFLIKDKAWTCAHSIAMTLEMISMVKLTPTKEQEENGKANS